MSRTFSRKPSPAAVIACLALFVALGGTGYAAVKINGKNLKNGSVAGSKLKRNTLTGTQINESKLGIVPKANLATTATTATHALSADTTPAAANATAVNGQKLERFSLTVASNGVQQRVTLGAVGFAASCPLGEPMLEVHNGSSQTAALEANWVHNDVNPIHAAQFHDEDFASDDSDDIAAHGSGGGTALVAFADGSVTSIDYGFFNDSQNNGNGCRFFGRVISG